MGPRATLWARRARVVAALQLCASLPLLASLLPASLFARKSDPLYVPVGSFERRVEMVNRDWKKVFSVEVVVLIDGPDARELAERMTQLMPRVKDVLRGQLDRVDPAEIATLRGRQALKTEMLRDLVSLLGSDQVREVLFERYQLD